MGQRSRPTQLKRQRERAQVEKRNQKAARRLEANKARKASLPRRPGDEDPDIAGIRPGPQPSPYDDMPTDSKDE